ncbi:hypothetical protein QYF61_003719, partial [Mycteria americana]
MEPRPQCKGETREQAERSGQKAKKTAREMLWALAQGKPLFLPLPDAIATIVVLVVHIKPVNVVTEWKKPNEGDQLKSDVHKYAKIPNKRQSKKLRWNCHSENYFEQYIWKQVFSESNSYKNNANQVLEGCYKVSLEPSLLQAEPPQLSQPFLTGEVLQPSDNFCGPPLDSLQQVHVFPVQGTPELDAVLQVGSHQSRVEGQNHLPQPAGLASFDAAQDTVDFLGCKRTLLGHVELLINQRPQVFLLRAALNPFTAQPVFVLGIAPTHVQDLALGLAELHEVHTGPPLKPVKVPLDGIPPLQHVNRTTQLGVVGKRAEGALSHGTLQSRSLKRPKSALLKSRVLVQEEGPFDHPTPQIKSEKAQIPPAL